MSRVPEWCDGTDSCVCDPCWQRVRDQKQVRATAGAFCHWDGRRGTLTEPVVRNARRTDRQTNTRRGL